MPRNFEGPQATAKGSPERSAQVRKSLAEVAAIFNRYEARVRMAGVDPKTLGNAWSSIENASNELKATLNKYNEATTDARAKKLWTVYSDHYDHFSKGTFKENFEEALKKAVSQKGKASPPPPPPPPKNKNKSTSNSGPGTDGPSAPGPDEAWKKAQKDAQDAKDAETHKEKEEALRRAVEEMAEAERVNAHGNEWVHDQFEAEQKTADEKQQKEAADAESLRAAKAAGADAASMYQGGLDPSVARAEAERAQAEERQKQETLERLQQAAHAYQTGAGSAPPEKPYPTAGEQALHDRFTMKQAGNAVFKAQYDQASAEAKHRGENYFDGLRAHQKSRGFFDAVGERLGITKASDQGFTNELRERRADWVAGRAAQAKLMLDSIESRRTGRGSGERLEVDGKEMKHKGRASLDSAKVRERYQRMYVVREAVFGAEEAEQRARMEGLQSRDKNIIEAAAKAYQKAPPAAKRFIPMAVAGGFAAATGGVVSVIPILAMSGLSTGLRAGARFAEGKGFSKTAQALNVASQNTTFGGIGAFFAGKGTQKATEKQSAAAAEMLRRRQAVGDLADQSAFEHLSRSRQSAAAADAQIKAQIATARAAGSVAGSALGGAAMGGVMHAGAQHVETAAHPLHSEVPSTAHLRQFETHTTPPVQTVHTAAAETPPTATPHAVHEPASSPEATAHKTTPHKIHEGPATAESASNHGHVPHTEDDIQAIYAKELREHGLAPGSDKHIEDVLREIHHEQAAAAPHAEPAPVPPSPHPEVPPHEPLTGRVQSLDDYMSDYKAP